jgi:hypothetical protein
MPWRRNAPEAKTKAAVSALRAACTTRCIGHRAGARGPMHSESRKPHVGPRCALGTTALASSTNQ